MQQNGDIAEGAVVLANQRMKKGGKSDVRICPSMSKGLQI
jgi:hypothetical protein